ncbi:MAG TPA: LptF/LptG family permease [Armatimonadota bacterium]|jgi:lipopolysaccharide export system permease protein
MKILDRYLLRRMVTPFLLGVLVFLVVLLGDEARRLGSAVTGMRVPLELILRYLFYAAPGALVWSLPVGCLLGVAMTATLCTRSGGTTAMRVAGASFPRVAAAYVGLGIGASVLAFVLNEAVVPSASQRQRDMFVLMTQTQPVVHEAYDQYFRDEQGRIFYVGHMDAENNLLERVMMWQLDAQGRVRQIDCARRAVLRGSVWALQSGSSVNLDEQGAPAGTTSYAEKPIVLAQALQNYYADKRTPLEMSATELVELAGTLEQTGQDSHRLRVHLAFKYSLPLACLVLVLLAAPLADKYAHLGTFAGLVIAIALVFLYNGVRSWGLALGLAGVLPPWIAGWTQNVIFGVLGAVMLWRRR